MSELTNRRIEWDAAGQHWYETGVDRGVLYVQTADGYANGVAWNGLTSVSESPDGADTTDFWADNIKYASIRAAENYKGTIEAYTYPDEFAACDGSAEVVPGVFVGQQERQGFAFSYRTKLGNETASTEDDGYKIHIVYGASVSPSDRTYETVNDSPDAITLSWEFETNPVNVAGMKPTACATIDSRKLTKEQLTKVENKLYGSSSNPPTLIMPNEFADLIGSDT